MVKLLEYSNTSDGFYCWTRCNKACWSNVEMKPNHCEKIPDWKPKYTVPSY